MPSLTPPKSAKVELSWYPLIAYFLARFFRDGRPEFLWTAGVVFTCWCLGALYLPPFVTLGLVPFVAIAAWNHPGCWRSLLSLRIRHIVIMASCLSVMGLYLYTAREVLVGVDVVRETQPWAKCACRHSSEPEILRCSIR